MKIILLHKVTERLAHLLHARLSPLVFLLNLSLVSLLARILLILASSPHLHGVLISTGAALRGLNLSPDEALWKNGIEYKIELGQLFLLANLIILALLFSAKGGSTSFDATHQYNGPKPFDSLADHLHFDYYDPPLSSYNKLAVGSAPPFQLDISYGASTQQLLAIGTAAPSYKKLAVASAPPTELDRSYHDACTQHLLAIATAAPSLDLANSPPHMNETYTKHLELQPISQEINENQKTKTRPKSSSNHVALVNTYHHRNSDNPGIAKCRSNAQDMRLHECLHGKVPSPTSFPIRSNSMSVNRLELVPITADIILPHAHSSQKSLSRHKSDIPTSNRSANRYEYYGRTVNSTYYYEYARDKGCSTTKLYTASALDNLSAEEARKRFSDFASRKWKTIRKESQAECEASPPSVLLRICADTK